MTSGFPRRTVLLGLASSGWLSACAGTPILRTKDFTPISKSKETWRQLLPEATYLVMFEEYTEKPRSSALYPEKRDGQYLCAACYLPLFVSKTKYETGTGWPSFFRPIGGHLDIRQDNRLSTPRTEYHCARCSGHQGHVFNDGPLPTGLRYCNNGAALLFVPSDKPLPDLRT